jgi:hypothetical protein
LDRSLVLGGIITAIAVAMLLVAFRRNWISRTFLAGMGALYGLFAALLLLLHF